MLWGFCYSVELLVGWEVAMEEAMRCLKRFRKRYVILGSFALYQYGFEVDPQDVDVWLDPKLSEQDWRSEVQRVAGRHQVSDHSRDCNGIHLRHLRIECDPHVDVLNVATRLGSTTFDAVYDQSLASRLGRLLPLKTLVFCKSAARRVNDYYQCRKIFEELSEVWMSQKRLIPDSDDSA